MKQNSSSGSPFPKRLQTFITDIGRIGLFPQGKSVTSVWIPDLIDSLMSTRGSARLNLRPKHEVHEALTELCGEFETVLKEDYQSQSIKF